MLPRNSSCWENLSDPSAPPGWDGSIYFSWNDSHFHNLHRHRLCCNHNSDHQYDNQHHHHHHHNFHNHHPHHPHHHHLFISARSAPWRRHCCRASSHERALITIIMMMMMMMVNMSINDHHYRDDDDGEEDKWPASIWFDSKTIWPEETCTSQVRFQHQYKEYWSPGRRWNVVEEANDNDYSRGIGQSWPDLGKCAVGTLHFCSVLYELCVQCT